MDFQLIREYTRTLVALYVEDDRNMRESTSELFESYFKEIHTAEDGNAGYEKYVAYHTRTGDYYDLVIADINMPGQSGIEMIRQMQLLHKSQPIMIVSAHTESHYLLDAIDLDVASFVVKPLNLEKLLQALHKTSKFVVEQQMMELYQNETEKESVALNHTNRLLQEEIETLKSNATVSHNEVSKPSEQVKVKKNEERAIDEVQNASFDEQIQFLIADDITEMTLMLEDIDQALASYQTHLSSLEEFSKRVGERLKHYGATLAYYEAFYTLSERIRELGQILEYEAFPGSENEARQFSEFLQSFCNTLKQWQEHLPESSLQNLHDFDDSISSDIATMKGFWRVNEEHSEGDLELF